MKNKKRLFLILVLFVIPWILHCTKINSSYDRFLKRLQAEESYIGFFKTEKECITETTEAYLAARREFFLGVSRCKEDPEVFTEPFLEFCKKNHLLRDGCEEEWEKVLTILNYELYANKPIFEFSTDKVIEHRSLVFAEYPNKKLELDLFIPKEPMDDPMPAVVCIHGGGWVVNRRIWFEPFAQYLASKGMAAVTIDYRMLPAVRLIDCVFDSKAAVRWIRANAEKYNIDPNRIGAIGASAGAHLVTLLATTADNPELEGSGGNPHVSSAIQAVVGIATPAFNIKAGTRWTEHLGLSSDDLRLLSPYENITKHAAPLYLIHGTVDETVPPQNSQDMYDRYQEAGAYAELKWIPDEDHGFYEGTDIAIAMASAFFKKQFNQ